MLALLLAATLGCSSVGSAALVGLWESHETSGGIGQALELRADGSFVNATTVIVNFTYQLQGDRLQERLANDESGKPPGAVVVRFEPGAWIQTSEDGFEVRWERVGDAPAGAAPIVGVWRSTLNKERGKYVRYQSDGTMQLRMPIRSVRGCYSIAKDRLSLTAEGSSPAQYRYTVTGGELELETPGEKEPRLLDLATGGDWYGLEQSAMPER